MSLLLWQLLDRRMVGDELGLIVGWLDDEDPRSAREQIDANYQHGGGWRSMARFKLVPGANVLLYPGDPPLAPIARAKLRDEWIVFYPHAWLAIIQPDGSFEVCRVD